MKECELMTNYELAKWLAYGCGQKRNSPDSQIRMYHNYFPKEEDEEVDNKLRIRRWGDEAWVRPTQIIFYEDTEASDGE